MRQILSIFLALIITVLLFTGMGDLSRSFYISFDGFPFFAVIFLGGIIATWFSTENKMRYSVYYGVIFAVMYGFFYHLFSVNRFIALILISIIAGMGGAIAKNEKNIIKNLLNNKFQGKNKIFFINLYKRNKRVLIASIVIFFASVLIDGVGPYLSSSFNHFITNLMIHYLSAIENKGLGEGTTLSIFVNNSNVAFFDMYIYGILFGITSSIELAYTGFIIGFTIFKYPFSIFYM